MLEYAAEIRPGYIKDNTDNTNGQNENKNHLWIKYCTTELEVTTVSDRIRYKWVRPRRNRHINVMSKKNLKSNIPVGKRALSRLPNAYWA